MKKIKLYLCFFVTVSSFASSLKIIKKKFNTIFQEYKKSSVSLKTLFIAQPALSFFTKYYTERHLNANNQLNKDIKHSIAMIPLVINSAILIYTILKDSDSNLNQNTNKKNNIFIQDSAFSLFNILLCSKFSESPPFMYFPYYLFTLRNNNMNIIQSLIVANICNQFHKSEWIKEHTKNDEEERKNIFLQYENLKKEYKDLLPNFKQNYSTTNKDILCKNKFIYSNFIFYVILDKTKEKIEQQNENDNTKIQDLSIGYNDLREEWNFFTSLVQNCKVYCAEKCYQKTTLQPCKMKDYLYFGQVDCSDIAFFNENIFNLDKYIENTDTRTIANMTDADNNVFLKDNVDKKEMLAEIEKIQKEILEDLEKNQKSITNKLPKFTIIRKSLSLAQQLLLYFF